MKRNRDRRTPHENRPPLVVSTPEERAEHAAFMARRRPVTPAPALPDGRVPR